jgi:hypothetical protein
MAGVVAAIFLLQTWQKLIFSPRHRRGENLKGRTAEETQDSKTQDGRLRNETEEEAKQMRCEFLLWSEGVCEADEAMLGLRQVRDLVMSGEKINESH